MGTITAVVIVCCLAAGAFFIFIDEKKRVVIGYGFTFLAIAIGLMFKILGS